MIIQPESMTFSDKTFSMIIYGSPGVGKTTLALSAPDPVLIDFDRGMCRVKAQHRKAAIFCDSYNEVLTDVMSPAMEDYKTVVVDTGGSFVTYLQDWAMKSNPAQNCQKNGAISLKGFGVVKAEFNRFTNYVRDTLHKNLIYVFHSQEQTDKDGNAIQRLMCEGAARNIVWTPCDFGGYVQMIGNRRVICFTPEQEFFAKGCHGVNGQMSVPDLGPNDPNDFISRLFDRARATIAEESEAFAPLREQYEKVMAQICDAVDRVVDVETANEAAAGIPLLDHALTSKREASAMLSARTKELGLVWDKQTKAYVEGE